MNSQYFAEPQMEDDCFVRLEIASGRSDNRIMDGTKFEYIEYCRAIFKIQQELKQGSGQEEKCGIDG